ncbi:NUDIX domain-containing protein [Lactococcus lactis]|nr:NUDIX domain-containing protein [Lactococcus lactis]
MNRSSIAHFTASAFVLNESHDKILGIYHKIYQSWGWVGGHADGNADLLAVAVKEVQEETGLQTFKNFQKSHFQLKPYLFLDIITENMVMSVLIFILMLLFYLKQRKVIHFKRIRMKQRD